MDEQVIVKAYYIYTAISHGTFAYNMSRGEIQNADIVNIDILFNAITNIPWHLGIDTDLTS